MYTAVDTVTMHCWIYKSAQRAQTYLYLAKESGFDAIPVPLMRILGKLERVMDIDLNDRKTLARADVSVVKTALWEQGYYLQLPPAKEDIANMRD